MAANAPEPQVINKNHNVAADLFSASQPGIQSDRFLFVVVLNNCTGSYHELLEQILLVQLVLQDLDDSFDP